MEKQTDDNPRTSTVTRNFLYLFSLLSLFLSAVFWLNVVSGTGNSTYLDTLASKFLFLVCLFFSLSFCLGISFFMMGSKKQEKWLLPYITMVLSGMMILAIFFILFLYGNSFFTAA